MKCVPRFPSRMFGAAFLRMTCNCTSSNERGCPAPALQAGRLSSGHCPADRRYLAPAPLQCRETGLRHSSLLRDVPGRDQMLQKPTPEDHDKLGPTRTSVHPGISLALILFGFG